MLASSLQDHQLQNRTGYRGVKFSEAYLSRRKKNNRKPFIDFFLSLWYDLLANINRLLKYASIFLALSVDMQKSKAIHFKLNNCCGVQQEVLSPLLFSQGHHHSILSSINLERDYIPANSQSTCVDPLIIIFLKYSPCITHIAVGKLHVQCEMSNY